MESSGRAWVVGGRYRLVEVLDSVDTLPELSGVELDRREAAETLRLYLAR